LGAPGAAGQPAAGREASTRQANCATRHLPSSRSPYPAALSPRYVHQCDTVLPMQPQYGVLQPWQQQQQQQQAWQPMPEPEPVAAPSSGSAGASGAAGTTINDALPMLLKRLDAVADALTSERAERQALAKRV
jgi:hypothetical protein